MIEFTGYLTGSAKKCYIRRTVKYIRNTFLVGAAAVFPPIILFAIRARLWAVPIGCLAVVLVICVVPYVQIKIDKDKYLPKRICIRDDILLYVSDKLTESQSVTDVRRVVDYGEYYVLLFPPGKFSNKFICQKDLLTKGTLQEFEALFEDKIERK